jgi:hypothetical protein
LGESKGRVGAEEGEVLELTAWSGAERTLKVVTVQNALTGEYEGKSVSYKADGVWIATVDEVAEAIPTEFALEQNYPNPFNPSTTISYSIAQAGFVSLRVYTVLGEEIATLVNDRRDAGSFSVNWNAGGRPSGIYVYRLSVASEKGMLFDQTKKMTLVK